MPLILNLKVEVVLGLLLLVHFSRKVLFAFSLIHSRLLTNADISNLEFILDSLAPLSQYKLTLIVVIKLFRRVRPKLSTVIGVWIVYVVFFPSSTPRLLHLHCNSF